MTVECLDVLGLPILKHWVLQDVVEPRHALQVLIVMYLVLEVILAQYEHNGFKMCYHMG